MSQILTDHGAIQAWARERGAQPACMRGTGTSADPGLLRLDFTDDSGDESLQTISWDDWFRKFDEGGLGLLIDVSDQWPNFNRLVRADGA